jgi:hypothetical protein
MKQLTDLLASIGLGDGQGNTSATRVTALLLAVGFLITKITNAFSTHTPMTFTDTDLKFVGIVLGTLVGKTVAEGVAEKMAPTPAPITVISSSEPVSTVSTQIQK